MENRVETHVLVVRDSKDVGREDNHAKNGLPRCPRVEAEVFVNSLTLHGCPYRAQNTEGGEEKVGAHHGIPPLNGGVGLRPLLGLSCFQSMIMQDITFVYPTYAIDWVRKRERGRGEATHHVRP